MSRDTNIRSDVLPGEHHAIGAHVLRKHTVRPGAIRSSHPGACSRRAPYAEPRAVAGGALATEPAHRDPLVRPHRSSSRPAKNLVGESWTGGSVGRPPAKQITPRDVCLRVVCRSFTKQNRFVGAGNVAMMVSLTSVARIDGSDPSRTAGIGRSRVVRSTRCGCVAMAAGALLAETYGVLAVMRRGAAVCAKFAIGKREFRP